MPAAREIIQVHAPHPVHFESLRLEVHGRGDSLSDYRETLPVLIDEAENVVVVPNGRSAEKDPWNNC